MLYEQQLSIIIIIIINIAFLRMSFFIELKFYIDYCNYYILFWMGGWLAIQLNVFKSYGQIEIWKINKALIYYWLRILN